jgi:hypothetical protein
MKFAFKLIPEKEEIETWGKENGENVTMLFDRLLTLGFGPEWQFAFKQIKEIMLSPIAVKLIRLPKERMNAILEKWDRLEANQSLYDEEFLNGLSELIRGNETRTLQ